MTKKETPRFQALGFLDLVSRKLGVKCPKLVDHTNKKPKAPSPMVSLLLKVKCKVEHPAHMQQN
jgi:hypothetical protein